MSSRTSRGRPVHPDILTPGEWRVLEGIRHGLSNPQIAKRQSISVDAVKFHVSNILSKLGFTSRKELRVWDGIEASSRLGKGMGPGRDVIGSIGQIARTVSDLEASIRWYGEVLGLRHLFTAGNMAFFDCEGIRLMLSEGKVEPESILYFNVDEIHGALEKLSLRGAHVLSAPHRIHTHDDGSEEWMAFVEDNDGRPIALINRLCERQGSNP